MSERSLNDDIFETLLTHSLLGLKEELLQQTQDEYNQAQILPAPLPPPAVLKAIKQKAKAPQRANLRQGGPTLGRVSHIPLKKLIAVAAVLILVFSCGAVAYASRHSLFHFLFNKQPQYTELQVAEDMQTQVRRALTDEWEYFYMPQKIPKGYTFNSVKIFNNICTMHFVGEEPDSRFYFTQNQIVAESSSSLSIDTENAKTKHISINGFDAFFVTKENWINISFVNNDTVFWSDFFGIKPKHAIDFMDSLTKIKK